MKYLPMMQCWHSPYNQGLHYVTHSNNTSSKGKEIIYFPDFLMFKLVKWAIK